MTIIPASRAPSSSCTAGRAIATTTALSCPCSRAAACSCPTCAASATPPAPAEAAEAVAYGVDGQAAEVIALIEDAVGGPVVLGGYDVGSRTAQGVARARPDLVRGMVISPPVPGVGTRILGPGPQREFWYQSFHRLDLSERLIDGNRAAVRAYLEHFWTHWSGPDYVPEPGELDRLADAYARPGAFVRSVNWYRSGSAAVARALAEETPDPADRIGAADHAAVARARPALPT